MDELAAVDRQRLGVSPWSRVIARSALITGLLMLALFVLFSAAFLTAGEAPEGLEELAAAAESPLLYRVGALVDAVVWLGIGATLLFFAVLLRGHSPVWSVVLAGCAVGQVVGALGGKLRLYAGAPLAAEYAAADPAGRAAIEVVAVPLWAVIESAFSTGGMLYRIAFLVIAGACLGMRGFPRWLAVFMGVVGGVGLMFTLVETATGGDLGDVWLAYIASVMVLMFATAAGLWRRELPGEAAPVAG